MSTRKRPSTITGLRKGIGTAPAAETSTDVGHVSVEQPPRPEKPVRFTVDLDRDRHRYLKEYALMIDARASEVIRELLDEMRNDDDLRARVRARIWGTRRS